MTWSTGNFTIKTTMKTTTGTRAKTKPSVVLSDELKTIVEQARAFGYTCYVIHNRKYPRRRYSWCYITNKRRVCVVDVGGGSNCRIAYSRKITVVNPKGLYTLYTTGYTEMFHTLDKKFFSRALFGGATYKWHKELFTREDLILVTL